MQGHWLSASCAVVIYQQCSSRCCQCCHDVRPILHVHVHYWMLHMSCGICCTKCDPSQPSTYLYKHRLLLLQEPNDSDLLACTLIRDKRLCEHHLHHLQAHDYTTTLQHVTERHQHCLLQNRPPCCQHAMYNMGLYLQTPCPGAALCLKAHTSNVLLVSPQLQAYQ